MTKSKHTNWICIVIAVIMLIMTCAFINAESLGLAVQHNEPTYAQRLFRTDQVHTINIVVEESDWDEMIEHAGDEEYIQASVVIDGDSVKGVGIRPKGNSSLSMIESSDSDRYSFKVEFDHYSTGTNYYGLDKLVLNNIAQDNTYMKDYVSYQMMNAMGADAPLSSFINVTVNGESWGLYLAVEAIEESFASRVYGNDYGEIYKPDTMDLNNQENMGGGNGGMPDFENGEMPDFENGEMPDFENGEMPDFENGEGGGSRGGMGGGFGGMGGGFGSNNSAVSLLYSDDDPDSYSAIFDNAAFEISAADQTRLVASLKQLNQGENIADVVDTDEVMRYFAVHNFVLNSDSYTGNMIHNYYLSESDGQLSMIAWDYNLAFGGMGMGRNGGGMENESSDSTTADTATTMANYPIDSPLLSGSMDEKPMLSWIFENEEYLNQYHAILAEYMEYFDSGAFTEMYDEAIALIASYVESDPSAFCTYEEFQAAQTTLRDFCLLRAESISGQLDGTIASTSEGQTESENANFVDASAVDMELMGSNSMGFGRARGNTEVQSNSDEATNTDTQNNADEPANTDTQNNADKSANTDNQSNADQPDRTVPANNADGQNNRFAGRGQLQATTSEPTIFSLQNMSLLGASAVLLLCGIIFAKLFWKKT